MISKIVAIKNVGVLSQLPLDLSRVTLIYGQNGRGKSTLCAVLKGFRDADAGRILSRTSRHKKELPTAHIIYDDGNKNSLEFNGSDFVGKRPLLEVFDADFIHENVYSGQSITLDQQKSLLKFVLGESEVRMQLEIEELKAKSRSILSDKINPLESKLILAAKSQQYDFLENLQPIEDVDNLIKEIEKSIGDIDNAENIKKRLELDYAEKLEKDIATLSTIAATSLENIEDRASEILEEFLRSRNASEEYERWLEDGALHLEGENCPFCGQPIHEIEIVKAYRTIFNAEFNKLKSEMDVVSKSIDSWDIDTVVKNFKDLNKHNQERCQIWGKKEISVKDIDLENLSLYLKSAKALLVGMAKKVRQQLTEQVVIKEEITQFEESIAKCNELIEQYSDSVGLANAAIRREKAKIETGDIQGLRARLERFKITKEHANESTKSKFKELKALKAERQSVEKQYKSLEKNLETESDELLGKLSDAINDSLTDYSAQFRIRKPIKDKKGQKLSYTLELPNALENTIMLQTKVDYESYFGNVLSEGDKRTLAFAFFTANLESMSNDELASKTIVIDDPISSLDRDRQRATIRRLASLSQRCKQLIVLSHDARFLLKLSEKIREVHQRIGLDIKIEPSQMDIVNGLTLFSYCDLHKEASSGFSQYMANLEEFSSGASSNTSSAIKDTRRILESYLIMKYPPLSPFETLGKIIGEIRNKSQYNHLSGFLDALTEINDDVTPDEHAMTNGDSLNENEARKIVNKTLELIRSGL